MKYFPAHTSHTFHLIATICTGLLWIPIWVFCANQASRKNRDSEFKMMQAMIDNQEEILKELIK